MDHRRDDPQWRAALGKLLPYLFPHEIEDIESTIAADERLQHRAEQAARTEQDPLRLVDFFKPYLLPRPPQGDFAAFERYNDFMAAIDRRVDQKWKLLRSQRIQESEDRVDWLPKEDNPHSLGRHGSTRVDRVTARLEDIELEDFPVFWANNSHAILSSIPKECLRQRVTDESSLARRTDSYRRQRDLLVELAKAIAHARGVLVEITYGNKGAEDAIFEKCYSKKPDGYFAIGKITADIEQKTEDGDLTKIAVARGQVVVLGNSLWRMRTRYEHYKKFENEVVGFVGTGIKLQCLRQIHAYQKKVRCFDGPLLQLAEGNFQPGDWFVVDLNSDAVKWAAAALDRMVMTEANTIRAPSQVNKHVYQHDYGTIKLKPVGGYWIGNQYLDVPTKQPSSTAKGFTVTVLGASRNNELSAVLRVAWEGELWWLKVGPDVDSRRTALQEPDKLPTGGWERWFQTERDMLSRVQLGEAGSAFAVSVAGANRPAMLVRDVGDSLERLLFSRDMTPCDVHEMSRQVYGLLEASGKQGVIHGDVCLENICYKDGGYSLIDWGLACGRPFSDLAAAVDKTWPGLHVMGGTCGVPNWEMSAGCCFHGLRPSQMEDDLESLLYCCMKILGGPTLPWSDAASSGTEFEVLQLRTETVTSFVDAQARYIYQPLLRRLGLRSSLRANAVARNIDVRRTNDVPVGAGDSHNWDPEGSLPVHRLECSSS